MNVLKELRTKKGVYQKDVASFLQIDRTTYVKYENGDSEPNLAMLNKIADFFDVSIDYLLGRKEKAAPEEEQQKINTIKIFGRDGSCVERELTDDQIDLMKKMIEQMPDASDL